MHKDSQAKGLSCIKTTFGNIEQVPNPPIQLALSVDLHSSKIMNKRFNTAQYLNIEIPLDSFLLELEAKGEGEDLAAKLNEIKGKSEAIKQMEQQSDTKVRIIGKGDKAYIVVQTEMVEPLSQLNKILTQLNTPMEGIEQRVIEFKLKGGYKLSEFIKNCQGRSMVQASLESLQAQISFNKSEGVKDIVKNLLAAQFGPDGANNLVDAFDHVNLDMKFDSAGEIKGLANFTEFLKPLELNLEFKQAKGLIGNKIEFFHFGKPAALSGSIYAEEIQILLDILLA